MKYDVRHKPTFATVFVTLQPGEQIVAEAGAMASMDGDEIGRGRVGKEC